jgi:hypothetical protein
VSQTRKIVHAWSHERCTALSSAWQQRGDGQA